MLLALAIAVVVLSVSPVEAATVTLAWNPNPESNIAGYIISYGIASGVYSTSVDVGNVTTWTVNLAPGHYYFVAQAYNTGGLRSPYSSEVSGDVGLTPTVTSLSPTSGVVGTPITIVGTNFGAAQGSSQVTFTGAAGTPVVATPTSWSATTIVVPVPAGAASGGVSVTVGGVASNSVTFTVTAALMPTIASLSPASGSAGTSVTIAGSNFGATQGSSQVRFTGAAGTPVVATPASWSATTIVVPVPAGAASGGVSVTVGGVISNSVTFTVTAATPAISSLSPASGTVGTSVTIAGSNFGATQGSSVVSFNGIAASPASWSTSAIVAPVPTGATTGPVTVTVNGVASNAATFTVVTSTLPAPWDSQDIGSPAVTGSASFANGRFTVAGAGNDIENTSDQFRFVYQPLNGDSEIRAQITSLQNGNAWSKAAVMIRETLTGDSPYAMMGITPGNGAVFQARATQGGATISVAGARYRRSPWVRVVRSGTTLSGYLSVNGSSWKLISTATVSMAAQVYVGFAVTSHDVTVTETASFANAAVTGAAAAVSTMNVAAPGQPSAAGAAGAEGVTTDTASAAAAPAGPTPASPAAFGDYDGDGKADLALFRPSTATWLAIMSSTNAVATIVLTKDLAAGVPVSGDFDGDGKADVAFYDSATGRWTLRLSSDQTGRSTGQVFTGDEGAVPVPADFDGDGKTDIASYAPSTGRWRILTSTSGFAAERTIALGGGSVVPVPGDYDGDGKADPAVYQPATGQWHVLLSSTDYATRAVFAFGAGAAGDVAVPRDYDGDGISDPAVYQRSTGIWLARLSGSGFKAVRLATLGSIGDIPVPADYDGDGRADVAVFRDGMWQILASSTDYARTITLKWGQSGDIPVSAMR